jgi:hypothetical protein
MKNIHPNCAWKPSNCKKKIKKKNLENVNKLTNYKIKMEERGMPKLDPIFFLVLNLVREFWIGIFLSFYFKLGPKHMNLSLCPNQLGLKRTLKFLEMAALFHIHCQHWALLNPTCFFFLCLSTPLTTTPPRKKAWIFC